MNSGGARLLNPRRGGGCDIVAESHKPQTNVENGYDGVATESDDREARSLSLSLSLIVLCPAELDKMIIPFSLHLLMNIG